MNEERSKVLVIDDDPEVRQQIRWGLAGEFEVLEAGDRASAVAEFDRGRPGVVTLDLSLSPGGKDMQGFDVLERILQVDPHTKVIMITGSQDDAIAQQAIRMGAYDYFSKPVSLGDLALMIRRAQRLRALECAAAPIDTHETPDSFFSLYGRAECIQSVYEFVRKVAGSDVTVLVLGESGVGKELVAQAIYQHSPRRSQPFIVVNCGAIPETLLESELFGYEKGAFTGAGATKRGKFELAEGGTLFLDEVGDLSPMLQVKLLRFLQDHTIERVGGIDKIQLDVRIIAATNRDLDREVQSKLFRDDLYYRLRVLRVTVPPLRERGEDVLMLANHFMEKFCRESARPRKQFTRAAEQALLSHSWPGNVRELENLIQGAVILSQGRLLGPADLGLTMQRPGSLSLREAREALEIRCLRDALERNRGSISGAARDLGISRPSLYDMLNKYRERLGPLAVRRRADDSVPEQRAVARGAGRPLH